MNFESPTQQVRALFHAEDAQAFFPAQIVLIKSNAFIGHRDLEFVADLTQSYFCPSGAAMFLHITEPFLNNAEQTQSHIRLDRPRDIVGTKINFKARLSSKLPA
jgi:hypothetical protein